MQPTNSEPFEALPMPRKDIPQPASGSYKIYKNSKEFVTVEAGSALEALQLSGIKAAYKIERDSIDYIRVLSPSAWDVLPTEAPIAVAVANAAVESKETVFVDDAAAAAKPVQPEAAAALSNDDVNKLLNS